MQLASQIIAAAVSSLARGQRSTKCTRQPVAAGWRSTSRPLQMGVGDLQAATERLAISAPTEMETPPSVATERLALNAPTEMEAENDEPLTTMPETRRTQSDAATPGSASSGADPLGAAGRPQESDAATPGSASSGADPLGAAGRPQESAAAHIPISDDMDIDQMELDDISVLPFSRPRRR